MLATTRQPRAVVMRTALSTAAICRMMRQNTASQSHGKLFYARLQLPTFEGEFTLQVGVLCSTGLGIEIVLSSWQLFQCHFTFR